MNNNITLIDNIFGKIIILKECGWYCGYVNVSDKLANDKELQKKLEMPITFSKFDLFSYDKINKWLNEQIGDGIDRNWIGMDSNDDIVKEFAFNLINKEYKTYHSKNDFISELKELAKKIIILE